MSLSYTIALAAIFIALVVPGLQILYNRRHEWHEACKFLCDELSSMLIEINDLIKLPNKVNHNTFQYYVKRRLLILELYNNRFICKRNYIAKAKKIIINQLMVLPEQIEYEELLLLGV